MNIISYFKCFFLYNSLVVQPLQDTIDKNVKMLWKEFQSVPVDRNGNLKAAWYAFPKGTNKNDVYDWFNRNYSKGLAYLMEEVKNNEKNK